MGRYTHRDEMMKVQTGNVDLQAKKAENCWQTPEAWRGKRDLGPEFRRSVS